MLNVGDKAPDVAVQTMDGETTTLAAWAGKPIVVYFYPKADTPGCTNEAIDFTSLAAEFAAIGMTVIGVSKDKPSKLGKFAQKYGLGVTLLSDEQNGFTEAFGAWVEKSMYGKSYMGIARCTFLIDASGSIVDVWPAVKVKGHAQEVLDRARAHFGA